MKFKVGDKVRVLDGKDIKDYKGSWFPGMCKYVGTVQEVGIILDNSSVRLKGSLLRWDVRGLEKVDKQNETIVIYRKDREVIALDKSTGKKAVAKCSPNDKFDFHIGANLAVNRLFGKEVRATVEEKPKLYNGKVVCVEAMTGNLTTGKIYEFVDGYSKYDNGDEMPTFGDGVKSFDDIKRMFLSYFIEIVEEK